MQDIHEADTDKLFEANFNIIAENQAKFESKFEGKSMADILKEIEDQRENGF